MGRHAAIAAVMLSACYLSMGQDLHIKPGGLFTDPSAYSSAPAGALRVADNIVIRRDGVAEARPGFEAATLSSPPAHDPRAMFAYDGDVLVIADSGAGSPRVYSARWLSDTSTAVNPAGGGTWLAKQANENRIFAAEARKNLYVTGMYGVQRLSSSSDTSPEYAGLSARLALAYITNVTGSAIANNETVAYVAASESERGDNNLVVTSPPSGRLVFTNNSGGALGTTIRVYIRGPANNALQAGDIVRLFRTVGTTGTEPGESLYQCNAVELVSADITAGYVDIDDVTPDAELGRALYTNPGQQGAESANLAPPECADIALFRGSMFFADVLGPKRIVLTWDDGGTLTTDTGIGKRTYTDCRRTNSSAVITLSDTTGLRVGQMLSDRTSWGGAGPVTIDSIVANTSVTMSETWGGSSDAVDATLTWEDTILIDTATYTAASPFDMVVSINYGDSTRGITRATTFFAYSVGDGIRQKYSGSSQIKNAVVVIEETRPGYSAVFSPTLQLAATHGDEYKPGVPLYDSASYEAFEADDLDNGLMWSKQDEPEHVPLPHMVRVGGQKAPILRIIPTRDALFIFKTDGIWRLTGAGSPGWRIDPFDVTTYLLAPKAVAVLDDVIYAWTNHGVVAVSDAGVQRLSDLHIGTDLRQAQITLGAGNTTTPGVFAVANPKDNEVIFGVCDADAETKADTLYVFNTKTGAWTKWLKTTYACGVFDPSDNKLKFAKGDDYEIDTERLDFARADTSDYRYTIIGGAVSGNNITWSSTSPAGYSPQVGDLIWHQTPSVYAVITAVNSTTDVDVDDAGAMDFDDTNAYGYASYQSCIEPVARTGGNASALKHFREGSWVFGSLDEVAEVTLSHSSDLSATAVTETRSFTRAASTQPRPVRFNVPRAHARTAHYWPKLCIQQAGSSWLVEQVSLFYESVSSRVRL